MGVLERELIDLEWSSGGEMPAIDIPSFEISVQEDFEKGAINLGRGLHPDHEVGTEVDGRWYSLISDRKKGAVEIAAVTALGLSVAGVFMAKNKLRLRHKK
jgi:hypothetical protein